MRNFLEYVLRYLEEIVDVENVNVTNVDLYIYYIMYLLNDCSFRLNAGLYIRAEYYTDYA